MANAADVIPVNADKVLFAEDLINFVLSHLNGTSCPAKRAGDFREFIYNGFNEDVREAVEFTIHVLEWEIDDHFSTLHERHAVNLDSFVDYAHQYQVALFNKGLEPDKFLTYCVRLASMASYFVTYDVKEALDKSLEYILAIFEEYDMYLGGWDAINNVAKRCRVLSKDFKDLLTPESSDFDSDESSDQSEDEDSGEYHLQNVGVQTEQFEELPYQRQNEGECKNGNYIVEDGRKLNCFLEDIRVPPGGYSDQNSSEDEAECSYAQSMEPCVKLEQKEKGFICNQSMYSEFDFRRNSNYDSCKNGEEIDWSYINQRNLIFFMDKLQKLARQKRDYEQIHEETETKFKRLKSADLDIYSSESDESSGKNSLLHKDGETGVSLLSESGMLAKNNQSTFEETVTNSSDVLIPQENCQIDFSRFVSQRKDTDTKYHKERMNKHNELKATNQKGLHSETS